MAITDRDVDEAEARMAGLRRRGYALAARYEALSGRIVIDLSTGVQLAFPASLAEGLSDASPDDLAEIEIGGAGLGLHWPKLDADVYVPGLLDGVFGSGADQRPQGRAAAQDRRRLVTPLHPQT